MGDVINLSLNNRTQHQRIHNRIGMVGHKDHRPVIRHHAGMPEVDLLEKDFQRGPDNKPCQPV